MAAGGDREGSLTLYIDNLVTKNSLALKGEEEVLTVAQVAKRGFVEEGLLPESLYKCLWMQVTHRGVTQAFVFLYVNKFAVN